MGRLQRVGEVRKQPVKFPGQRGRPRDQNIVVALQPIKGKDCPGGRAQSPLGAVAGHGVADFLAGGKSEPCGPGTGLRGGAGFQRQAAPDTADAAGSTQEISAFFQAAQGKA